MVFIKFILKNTILSTTKIFKIFPNTGFSPKMDTLLTRIPSSVGGSIKWNKFDLNKSIFSPVVYIIGYGKFCI